MSKDAHVHRAKGMGKPAKRLARLAAEIARREDAQARQIVGSQAAAGIMAMIAPANQPRNSTSRKALPALLSLRAMSCLG